MLKAKAMTADGQLVLFIGLSGENVTRLVAGEPISFETSELGLPPMRVAVFYGRTDEEMLERMRASGLRIPEGFTCPVCKRTSHHPEDVRHGYCGACHAFTGGDPAVFPGPPPPAMHPGSWACGDCYAANPQQYQEFPTSCPHYQAREAGHGA